MSNNVEAAAAAAAEDDGECTTEYTVKYKDVERVETDDGESDETAIFTEYVAELYHYPLNDLRRDEIFSFSTFSPFVFLSLQYPSF